MKVGKGTEAQLRLRRLTVHETNAIIFLYHSLELTSNSTSCLWLYMAHVIVFPDHESFQRGIELRRGREALVMELHPPRFCQGLFAPSLLVTAGLGGLKTELEARGIPFSGTIPYQSLNRAIPEAPPPDPVWKEVLRGFRLITVRPSVTDPRKFRMEASSDAWPASLIPVMARLIRGGTFLPDLPILAFEEQHRLIVFSAEGIVISRADDLLDLWIMIRTSVDLVCSAHCRRATLGKEREPRYGISAIEIFRRLPGTDCGLCEHRSCMEFATSLLTGRSSLDKCTPLRNGGDVRLAQSLEWLLRVMGLLPGQ